MNPNPESRRNPTWEELVALVAAQAAEIAALKAEIAELKRRQGLNSSNSSKPPSSDGLGKPPRNNRTRSTREPSGRPSGGQKGHKGETLLQVTVPDKVVDHLPPSCPGCGAAMTPAMTTGYRARQVFDLPEPAPRLVATEHRAHDCACGRCGALSRGAFPAGVNAPVQYGERIAAVVVYLSHDQLLPEDRLAAAMADLFGVKLAAATIAHISHRCAARLAQVATVLRERVLSAPVKHLDETGFRIGGKTQWLHVASTALLTFYRTCHQRGAMLANVVGTVVHDHWKPYYTLPDVDHALCNAHHLRELKALIEIEKEEWARAMAQLLRRACHATNLAAARERPLEALKPRLVELIERRYDAIVAAGLAYHEAQPALGRAPAKGANPRGRAPRRTGHNLLLRLLLRKQDALRFLHHAAVPFTNNLAEGDLRMMKVKQKISGGFRSEHGASDFATIRSVISTAKKHGWNVIQALAQEPLTLISALRSI
jgi:transposase